MINNEPKYEMIIYWDYDAKCFIGEAPELESCIVKGFTHQETFQKLQKAMEKWLHKAAEAGIIVPIPQGKLPFSSEFFDPNSEIVDYDSHKWKRSGCE